MFNNIEVGFEYGFSLGNMYLDAEETDGDYKYSGSAKNKVFSLTVGYIFGE